ncbi:MAG: magnesium transporter [Alphaproteobacteria bacterium]|nr:magnesium transporter [Alphaproteobacteria bacterium]
MSADDPIDRRPPNADGTDRKPKERRKKLKAKIRELEAEIAETRGKAAEEEPLYGLTPRVEAAVVRALAQERAAVIPRLLRPLHPADQADLIERLDAGQRSSLFAALGAAFNPEILSYLDETVREEVVDLLGEEQITSFLPEMDSDDAIELIGELDEEEQARILKALPAKDRVMLEEGLTFPEDSAGRLMQREMVVVPTHWTVGQTIDFLRTFNDLPDDFYDIFVVDPAHRPVGELALSRLLRSKRPMRVSDIMHRDFRKIPAAMDQEEVALLFRQYGLVAAPVVSEDDRLLGVITVDDVVDVIHEEAEEDIMRLGGVGEIDLYGSSWDTAKARFPWLVVNLATAIAASMVIGAFDATIEKVVALAVLMPLVASMGGNAGTQTLTVAVRALATRDLTARNAAKFVAKETLVGSLNGLAFAALVAATSMVWFGDLHIAWIIALAMVINLVVAGLVGTLIPLGLDRFNIDPAVASGVFLTTVTDVVGFFTFLGLATLILL